MTQRITTQLLVTIRHEKPIDKIADVISCRLSMLEGVDGSGVDAVVVVPEPVELAQTDFDRDGRPLETSEPEKQALLEALEKISRNTGIIHPGLRMLGKSHAGLQEGETAEQADTRIAFQKAFLSPQAVAACRLSPLPGAAAVHESTPGWQQETEAHRYDSGEMAKVVDEIFEPLNKDGLSREQFDNYAAMLTKGMGENIIP